jgi:hypothetical protein
MEQQRLRFDSAMSNTASMPDTERFGWHEDSEALTVTLVRGLDPDGVIEQLGLRQAGDGPLTFEAAWADGMESPSSELAEVDFIQLDQIGDWTVILEDNGFLGSLKENLAPLSTNGQAVSIYWNVNAVCSFDSAVAGKVTRSFDPSGINGESGDPLPEESDLDFEEDDADFIGLSFLLMERLTGITLDGDWVLNRARQIYVAS